METLLRTNVHPNEPTSIYVAASFSAEPVENITVNEVADSTQRFVDCDPDLADNDPGLIYRDPTYPYPYDPIADPALQNET